MYPTKVFMHEGPIRQGRQGWIFHVARVGYKRLLYVGREDGERNLKSPYEPRSGLTMTHSEVHPMPFDAA
jgi:hypothetical protein